MLVSEMQEQFAVRHARFVAKQAFERAAFIYGQSVSARKQSREGTQARRDAVAAEDIAESRMSASIARFTAATAIYLSRTQQ
jgi:hypothetical protein